MTTPKAQRDRNPVVGKLNDELLAKLRRRDRTARKSGLDEDRRRYLRTAIGATYRALPKDYRSTSQPADVLEAVWWNVALVIDDTEKGNRGVVHRHKAVVALVVFRGKKAADLDDLLERWGGYKGAAGRLAKLRRKLKAQG